MSIGDKALSNNSLVTLGQGRVIVSLPTLPQNLHLVRYRSPGRHDPTTKCLQSSVFHRDDPSRRGVSYGAIAGDAFQLTL